MARTIEEILRETIGSFVLQLAQAQANFEALAAKVAELEKKLAEKE